MAIESESWKTPTTSRAQQSVQRNRNLMTSTNNVVAGRSVSTPATNNANDDEIIVDVDEKDNSQETKHKSPAAMTAAAALKSQDVALIAENNQMHALATQRKELELRQLEHKSSNNLIHHLLAEVKEKKKISSTELFIEKKSMLESKRSILGENVLKKRWNSLRKNIWKNLHLIEQWHSNHFTCLHVVFVHTCLCSQCFIH